MTIPIIITVCILVLLSYVFDLSSKKTKIPTVVLLLLLGWIVRQLATFINIEIPDLHSLLPILGTIGLVLIVLEGSLELEINRSKKKVLIKSTISSIVQIILLMIIFGYGFHYLTGKPLMISFLNAIPICIISSAIAIPTAQNLNPNAKEFVIYESSLSDIFGVIVFNIFATEEVITIGSLGYFTLELLVMLIISFGASIGLIYLLKKITHHVKYIPILLIIVLIYSISKIYHLPSLIFILLFGLFLNNINELKRFRYVEKLDPENFIKEIHRFREMIGEFAFLIRSLFFLLFGFLIDVKNLFNIQSVMLALIIVFIILFVRYVYFKISRVDVAQLLFLGPRGLITILLFLSIPTSMQIPYVNESLMILVIVFSSFSMMFGLMFKQKA
jgi:potassium/hydrogen antiporter